MYSVHTVLYWYVLGMYLYIPAPAFDSLAVSPALQDFDYILSTYCVNSSMD